MTVPTFAMADERTDRSTALRAEGNQLMDQRRFDEALARYQEALQLTPSDAAIYYNLSRVHELRGDAVNALDNMERFVMNASPQLKARVGELERVVGELRARVALVHIECTAPSMPTSGDAAARALVLVDERVVATGCRAHDIRLKAGRSRVRASADGYVGRALEVDLPGGAQTVVKLELSPRDTSGLLRMRTEPEHVAVSNEGRELGSTPLEIVLPAGSHRLTLSAPGYHDLEVPVVVAANSARDLEAIRLEKTPLLVTRWWFWTGVVVVAAAGVGLTYALVTERAPDRGDIPPGTAKLPLMRW